MAPETFDTVIERIEQGDTLKASIRAAKTSWRALSLEIARNPEAASRYARARSDSGHFYADKAQEAVEQALGKDDAAVAKVRADVYRWRAGVANPREYGDKIDVTSGGEALTIRIERVTLPQVPARIVEAVDAEVLTPHILSAIANVDDSASDSNTPALAQNATAQQLSDE